MDILKPVSSRNEVTMAQRP